MQRDLRLDLLRIAAIIAVIWLHVSGEVVVRDSGPGDADWWVGNVADAFSRWCVPLFVMASGALLLPQRPDIDPRSFYRRRAARIVVPTLFWTAIYLGLRALDDAASPRSLVISVVRGTPYYHLWFLYMIVGLYVATPLISRFLNGCPPRIVLAATGFVFLVSAVESLMAALADEEQAYTFLGMWPSYVGYFLAGYYLWRWPLRRVPRRLALVTILACGGGIALLTGALYHALGARAWQIAYANLQPLVVLMSLTIFTATMGQADPVQPVGGAGRGRGDAPGAGHLCDAPAVADGTQRERNRRVSRRSDGRNTAHDAPGLRFVPGLRPGHRAYSRPAPDDLAILNLALTNL